MSSSDNILHRGGRSTYRNVLLREEYTNRGVLKDADVYLSVGRSNHHTRAMLIPSGLRGFVNSQCPTSLCQCILSMHKYGLTVLSSYHRRRNGARPLTSMRLVNVNERKVYNLTHIDGPPVSTNEKGEPVTCGAAK
jgi:hypothetical protein